jgi:hypothetical protein
VPPVAEWQKWPRGYEPTTAQLEAMTEEEYDAWNYYENGQSKRSANHPTMRRSREKRQDEAPRDE